MTKKATASIKILIADQSAIIKEGIKHICASTKDIHVAATANAGIEAIKLCRSKTIHVLILDIALPDRNGIDVLKQAKREFPNLEVLVLSMFAEEHYAIRCLKAGAAGFLHKHTHPQVLIDAIRMIASGKKYISPNFVQLLANEISTPENGVRHSTLSDREYQTMIMIASGKNVSDIAATLLLSVKTISMYRARVLQKMQLRHNAELTHYAIKNGLVD
jgi:two-component system invasion response regulator UvrY